MQQQAVFDFDGVLMDSVHEVAVTAFRCITKETPTSLAQLPEHYLKNLLTNRHLVQPAGDFIVFARWCLDTHSVAELESKKFQGLLAREPQPLAERTKYFFSTRSKFIQENRDAWLALHQPFEPIWSEFKRRASELYIVTYKNAAAVLELTAFFGLNFPTHRLYAGERGIKKSQHLQVIMGTEPQALWFIDDSIQNLEAINNELGPELTQISLAHASWGYVHPSDQLKATELKIPVLSQTDVIQLLNQ
ncbi:hypothetical protein JNK13_11455 [bacterium]|nr:hypothetical protein [bacterium]